MPVISKIRPLPLWQLGAHKMIEKRLQELRTEYSRGEQQLAQLDQRRQELRDTLLRISGAIQVLEELLQMQSAAHQQSIHLPAAMAEILQSGNGHVASEPSSEAP
jgi:hypothetical protein